MRKYIDAELEIVEIDPLNTGLFNFSNPLGEDVKVDNTEGGQGDNDAGLW